MALPKALNNSSPNNITLDWPFAQTEIEDLSPIKIQDTNDSTDPSDDEVQFQLKTIQKKVFG